MAEVSCTAPWSTGTSPTWLLARPLSESKTHKKHTRKTVEDIIHGVVKTNCRPRTTAIDGNLHREKNIGQRVKKQVEITWEWLRSNHPTPPSSLYQFPISIVSAVKNSLPTWFLIYYEFENGIMVEKDLFFLFHFFFWNDLLPGFIEYYYCFTSVQPASAFISDWKKCPSCTDWPEQQYTQNNFRVGEVPV